MGRLTAATLLAAYLRDHLEQVADVLHVIVDRFDVVDEGGDAVHDVVRHVGDALELSVERYDLCERCGEGAGEVCHRAEGAVQLYRLIEIARPRVREGLEVLRLLQGDTFSISAVLLSIKVPYFSNSWHKNEKVTALTWYAPCT
eukprot:SAG31_NODE_857_length_11448_cov_15.111287_2_plen_144_part_00